MGNGHVRVCQRAVLPYLWRDKGGSKHPLFNHGGARGSGCPVCRTGRWREKRQKPGAPEVRCHLAQDTAVRQRAFGGRTGRPAHVVPEVWFVEEVPKPARKRSGVEQVGLACAWTLRTGVLLNVSSFVQATPCRLFAALATIAASASATCILPPTLWSCVRTAAGRTRAIPRNLSTRFGFFVCTDAECRGSNVFGKGWY